ncbi:uncharacterized protein E5676_scaffold600G00030 [Cucumis melo var. makuwa]|uniref:Uncharacterized protein n=1 Tax=Cucumis melo var. makuwa TaxID=1194695 RepID=A0A5D3DXH1_CUCMM|nr:uncharacterized protein E6C27_scaffold61G00030 [Cucumis melo var. makuwa]TYK28224.1 uncharacterized protein E5676_scaffold600G00030 [Cucumis melo var. makuwa]
MFWSGEEVKNYKGKLIVYLLYSSFRGTLDDSYAILSAFLDALIRNDPGTYTTKEVDDEAMKNNACTIYGNSQIVPLAFAVVDLENDLS